MIHDAIRQALEARIQDNFSVPGAVIHFDNTKFSTPHGPWAYVCILNNIDIRANIGQPNEFKALGVVNVTCMVPEGTGTKTLQQMQDAFFEILADKQVAVPGGGSVTTYGLQYRDRGVVNGWRTVNAMCEYRAFAVRS